MEQIRIVVVDDHPVVRDGLASIIEGQADLLLIGEAEAGREAIQMVMQLRPDIVLLDPKLPDMDGVQVIEMLSSAGSSTRSIVLTTYAGDVQARRALKAGAYGYLLKAALRRDLRICIREVHAGRRHIQQEVAVDMAQHLLDPELTPREIEVLHLIARGCSNKLIADKLHIREDTVKSHVTSMLSKLHAEDRTHAVTTALQRGFFEL